MILILIKLFKTHEVYNIPKGKKNCSLCVYFWKQWVHINIILGIFLCIFIRIQMEKYNFWLELRYDFMEIIELAEANRPY